MPKDIAARITFIENMLGWEGQINASHLAKKFQLSRQAATTVLKQYRESYPNNLYYDASKKVFIATADFDQSFLPSSKKHEFASYLTSISAASNSNQEAKAISICVYEVQAPLRNINPIQVRPILRAIREQQAIDIGYISLSSPNYLDRIIQPHALIFDGLRWHVRAFCNKNLAFRDFTLSRFNGDAIFEGPASHTAEQDEKWHTIVEVVITADPRFSDQQKHIIEQDYQMENGEKVISVRAALVNYLLKRLHIDSHKNTPEEQQIVLSQASRQAISPYLPQST